MKNIKINIRGREFNLTCSDEMEERLIFLVSRVNDRLISIAETNPNCSFDFLLVMLCLDLMDHKHSSLDKDSNYVIRNMQNDFFNQLSLINKELELITDKFITK